MPYANPRIRFLDPRNEAEVRLVAAMEAAVLEPEFAEDDGETFIMHWHRDAGGFEAIHKNLRDRTRRYLVATVGKAIVGSVSYGIADGPINLGASHAGLPHWHPWPRQPSTTQKNPSKNGEIDMLYVREHARGKGVGGLLIRTAAFDLYSVGCRAVQLELDTSEADLAGPAYSSIGFSPTQHDDTTGNEVWRLSLTPEWTAAFQAQNPEWSVSNTPDIT